MCGTRGTALHPSALCDEWAGVFYRAIMRPGWCACVCGSTCGMWRLAVWLLPIERSLWASSILIAWLLWLLVVSSSSGSLSCMCAVLGLPAQTDMKQCLGCQRRLEHVFYGAEGVCCCGPLVCQVCVHMRLLGNCVMCRCACVYRLSWYCTAQLDRWYNACTAPTQPVRAPQPLQCG